MLCLILTDLALISLAAWLRVGKELLSWQLSTPLSQDTSSMSPV